MPASVENTLREPLKQKMVGVSLLTALNNSISLDGAFHLVYNAQTGSSIQGECAQSVEQPWNFPPGKQLIWAYSIRSEEDFNKLGMTGIVAETNENMEGLYPGFKGAVEFQIPHGGASHGPSH